MSFLVFSVLFYKEKIQKLKKAIKTPKNERNSERGSQAARNHQNPQNLITINMSNELQNSKIHKKENIRKQLTNPPDLLILRNTAHGNFYMSYIPFPTNC